ncbi:hypothetical protein MYCTH_2300359 [Thermothelomyces thermophilus ATCC 42464]|uniref:Uncharacterized protein n=1 Tax=Thermothelomyces thermophilus (strain ATCC 42464 / BCRC 31852 / DSM 1799) TaxID=573729 RepID=G2QB46_THET4|nr:uncharacterized protein MYCTH_2300359 [Thermothelomyces thermophilus ATCC 42464]AEO55984.1 hypothetical protein MYCTH_2300359 [Thermothelomyces thermophilus ATCC 42464]
MRMGLRMMLRHVLAVLALLAAPSWARFTNAFDGINCGSDLVLTWDAVPPQYYPPCITAQVIDRNGDGFSANAYRVNITTGVSGTSYTWEGAPYPLRWILGGLYQLELRPMSWPGGDVPLLAKSPSFTIADAGVAAQPDGSAEEVSEFPNSAAPRAGRRRKERECSQADGCFFLFLLYSFQTASARRFSER